MVTPPRTHWLPKCCDVFRRLPPVPINGDAAAYFRAVATLQGNQLRQLVAASLEDYLALFRRHAPWIGSGSSGGSGGSGGASEAGAGQVALDVQGDTTAWSEPAVFETELVVESGESCLVVAPCWCWELWHDVRRLRVGSPVVPRGRTAFDVFPCCPASASTRRGCRVPAGARGQRGRRACGARRRRLRRFMHAPHRPRDALCRRRPRAAFRVPVGAGICRRRGARRWRRRARGRVTHPCGGAHGLGCCRGARGERAFQ